MTAESVDKLLPIFTALLYLLGAVGYGAYMMLRTEKLVRAARFATAGGVLTHFGAIGVHCALTHQTPFTTPADTLSATAWAIALAVLSLETFLHKAPPAIAAVSMPAAFLFLFAGSAREPHEHLANSVTAPVLNSGIVSLHVCAIVLAFGLLFLAFACSVLYISQNRMLKHNKVSGKIFGKLPPLATLDQLALVLVSFAFPMLTIGLISGAIKAYTVAWFGHWTLDEKIVLSFLTWLAFGAFLALHNTSSWRGLRSHYLLIAGIVLAAVTIFVPTGVHRF